MKINDNIKKHLKVWVEPFHGLHFHVAGCWMINYNSYIEIPLYFVLRSNANKDSHLPIRVQGKKYIPCACFESYIKSLPMAIGK